MSETYKVIFTHAAKVDAGKILGGISAVEARARHEIADLLENGLDCVADLVFHILVNEDGPEFFCCPNENGDLVVDACENDEAQEIETGPLAGKRIVVPRGFSS